MVLSSVIELRTNLFFSPKEFRDSTAFLKGTQSLNPHNDYSQHFVDTGQRPQNFIRDVGLADRFEEYPKLRELIKLKNDLVAETAHPPMYLKCDLEVKKKKKNGMSNRLDRPVRPFGIFFLSQQDF